MNMPVTCPNMGTLYVLKAERIEPGRQHMPHAGWPTLESFRKDGL
jgi:hypothetical protein